jgi:hypothetical protein
MTDCLGSHTGNGAAASWPGSGAGRRRRPCRSRARRGSGGLVGFRREEAAAASPESSAGRWWRPRRSRVRGARHCDCSGVTLRRPWSSSPMRLVPQRRTPEAWRRRTVGRGTGRKGRRRRLSGEGDDVATRDDDGWGDGLFDLDLGGCYCARETGRLGE